MAFFSERLARLHSRNIPQMSLDVNASRMVSERRYFQVVLHVRNNNLQTRCDPRRNRIKIKCKTRLLKLV